MVEPTEIIHVDPETQLPKPHNNKQFVFDNVFGPEVTTRTVYDDIVAPIVNEAFNGFNGTVLCYGQTSSGKLSKMKQVKILLAGWLIIY